MWLAVMPHRTDVTGMLDEGRVVDVLLEPGLVHCRDDPSIHALMTSVDVLRPLDHVLVAKEGIQSRPVKHQRDGPSPVLVRGIPPRSPVGEGLI